jgi:general secretion pathway protein H
MRAPNRARGFTLVEVIIVIGLIAILGGTIVSGSGMLAGNRLRSAAGLVLTGVRLGITRANATGRPVRLVFDIDASRLVLEETTDRMLRVKETNDSKASEGTAAGADPATQAEKEASEYADGIVKGPRAPRARFTAIKLGRSDEGDGKGRDLGRGIKYRAVQTEHDAKPRDKGRVYLYIWPGGGTERAAIQIQRDDKDSDEILTVLVSPLTGRAKIERGKVELEDRHSDEDFGTREAPL